MTNAELAAHFAKLPPDKKGTIFIIDADTASMTEEFINMTTEEDLADVADDFKEGVEAVGHPHVFRKW